MANDSQNVKPELFYKVFERNNSLPSKNMFKKKTM